MDVENVQIIDCVIMNNVNNNSNSSNSLKKKRNTHNNTNIRTMPILRNNNVIHTNHTGSTDNSETNTPILSNTPPSDINTNSHVHNDCITDLTLKSSLSPESIKSFNQQPHTPTHTISLDNYEPNSNSRCNHNIAHKIIPITECSIFEHQVGGHSIGVHSVAGGLLKYNDTVLKPVNPKRKGQCEKDFYLYENNHPHILRSFMPKFHGFVYIRHNNLPNSTTTNNNTIQSECIEDEMHEYIQLEDLTHNYEFPSIMDLKMGTQTYDEEASLMKITGDQNKYIHQVTLGMRVIGMKIYRNELGYTRKDKIWGRELTTDTIKAGLLHYFNGFISNVVPIVLDKLNQLLSWFQVQTDYRFYSSSLLILYESGGKISSDINNPLNVRVCMVDFTHVYGPSRSKFFTLHDDSLNVSGLHLVKDQKDEKYLHGLMKLIQILQDIWNDYQTNNDTNNTITNDKDNNTSNNNKGNNINKLG